jgi:hypothetical protein
MIKEALLKRRVARGAKLLDKKKPGWYTTIGSAIFSGRFRMSSWSSCVCGQLEMVTFREGRGPNYREVPIIALNGTALVGYDKAASHGFYYEDEEGNYSEGYQLLQDLWREEVEKRLTVSEARALGMQLHARG